MFLSETAKGVRAETDRCRASSCTSPLVLVPSAVTAATSLPTIMRANDAGVSTLGSQAPVTLPSRSTVARSQMRCTSSSRWLI
ncbi:hypothetical protein D9M72_598000 [compost metagenome]